MKKKQQYEGRIEKVIFPNKGIAVTPEGERAVVKNTIPGQKVSFAVNKARKGRYEGRLLEVLERAENELAEPLCPHFGICGGCTYQNLSYEDQLKLKESQLRELFRPVLSASGREFDQVFEGIKPSPRVFGYRNKMEFSFGDTYKDGPLALGMHRRGSFYDIVNVEQCRIVDEDYRKILTAVREFFGEKKIPYYHRLRHEGYLRHLLVRKAAATGEILIDLITTSQREGFLEEALLQEFADRLGAIPLEGKLAGILHTRNDSVADVVKNEGTQILFGEDFFFEELLGLKFKITPFSFFQTNSLGAEALYSLAREFIGDTAKKESTVFDLYSGTGTIAQMLAPAVGKVIGVEIVEEAVLAARENARLNGLSNCEFIAGDVLKVLDEIGEKPDFIVLDPPRDGIHPKALSKIIHYGVERMVYISCKPTSLVRDLEVLQGSGYEVVRMGGVDMFPGTGHVETCVLLTHKKPTSYIEVTMDYEKIVPNQKLGKATYKMITDYVKEKYDLVVKSTTIAEVKRSFGLEVGDYNVKDEKTNYRKEKITPEKRQAVEDALRHFGVIE